MESHGYSDFSEFPGKEMNVAMGAAVPQNSNKKTPNSITAVEHPEYNIKQHVYIDEYDTYATIYQHQKTKAEVLCYLTPDSETEKVFLIGFKTPPIDSKGTAHIVEHGVLAGSEKYKVKEPFVELLKGSLNTYLNATTYPDMTLYPVASVNLKDFYNLADVYMDAVFHPRAISDPDVLKQEGIRLSIDQSSDEETEKTSTQDQSNDEASESGTASEGSSKKPASIKYGGIVFNEMKGSFATDSFHVFKEITYTLFPDTCYQHVSGGDPKYIRELTFDQYKDFYEMYYHPANAKIIFSGNNDISERLDFAHEHLINTDLSQTKESVTIKTQTYIDTPIQKVVSIPSNKADLQDTITVSWALDTQTPHSLLTYQEKLELQVLNQIILASEAGELYRALIDCKLGTKVQSFGFSSILKNAFYSVGLEGIKQANADAKTVEDIIINTLKKCSENGFSKISIDAAINQLEFNFKECNMSGRKSSKGITMSTSSMVDWLHDGFPPDMWKVNKLFQNLHERLNKGEPIFENLIKKYFLENNHRSTIHFKSDSDFFKKVNEEEKLSLKHIQEKLTEDDIKKIDEEEKTLKQKQMAEDSPEDLAQIPTLKLEDLDKMNQEIETSVSYMGNVTVLENTFSTGGILYTNVGFKMDELSIDDFQYLSLFSEMVNYAGTHTLSGNQLTLSIEAYTGGISTSFNVSHAKQTYGKTLNKMDAIGYFIITGKATEGKIGEMFDLMVDMLKNTNFENSELGIEKLKEHQKATDDDLKKSGHIYVLSHMSSCDSVWGYGDEEISGITYYQKEKNIIEMAQHNWEAVKHKLIAIQHKLINTDNMIINLTGDKQLLNALAHTQADIHTQKDETHTHTHTEDTKTATHTQKDETETHTHTDETPTQIYETEKQAQITVLEKFIQSLPQCGKTQLNTPKWVSDIIQNDLLTTHNTNCGYAIATQVSYVGMSADVFGEGEEISYGKNMVFNLALRYGHLWDTIRVMEGAYGAFAKIERTGKIAFASYRDPNTTKTVKYYFDSPEALSFKVDTNNQPVGDDEEIKKAHQKLIKSIISTIGQLDTPTRPAATATKALWQFLHSETKQDRQNIRDDVLSTTFEDFNAFSKKLSEAFAKKETHSYCLLSSQENLKTFSESFSDKFTITDLSG